MPPNERCGAGLYPFHAERAGASPVQIRAPRCEGSTATGDFSVDGCGWGWGFMDVLYSVEAPESLRSHPFGAMRLAVACRSDGVVRTSLVFEHVLSTVARGVYVSLRWAVLSLRLSVQWGTSA